MVTSDLKKCFMDEILLIMHVRKHVITQIKREKDFFIFISFSNEYGRPKGVFKGSYPSPNKN